MNCKEIINNLGFECVQKKNLSIINTPFYSPIDGDGIQLFVEHNNGQYLITDFGKTAQHAESHNLTLNEARHNTVRLRSGNSDSLTRDWRIETVASLQNLQEKLTEALTTVLAMSQAEIEWLPAINPTTTFKAQVSGLLQKQFGNKLTLDYKVNGFSGHQYEIPFAIESESKLIIHYVSQIEGHQLRWPSATNIAGIMGDISRNEACNHYRRMVILDDQNLIDNQQLNEVNLLLNGTVTTLPYSNRADWIHTIAA